MFQDNAVRRDMHSAGGFQAPIGYSTKGLDFRRAYMQREADNSAIMHEIHEKEKAKAEAAADAAAGLDSSKSHPDTVKAQHGVTTAPSAPKDSPSISFSKISQEHSAGGVPLPPLILPKGHSGGAPAVHPVEATGTWGSSGGDWISSHWSAWRSRSSSIPTILLPGQSQRWDG